MKIFVTLFLLANFATLFAQQNNDGKFIESLIEVEKKGFNGTENLQKSADQENTYDLKYLRLEWNVDPAIKFIQGTITSYFVAEKINFNTIKFDLSAALAVDSIKYHDALITFERLDNDILSINLPSVISQGILDSVSVYYQGIPVTTGFGSFRQELHNDVPIIWTLSEPFGAKEWWPCKQSLNDKIDSIDVIVTTPQENNVASNGLLVGENVSGVNKTVHWKSNYPIASYLIAIGVTNYSIFSKYVKFSETDSLQVLNYCYPENLEQWQTDIQSVENILQFYDSLIVKYPFSSEKYGYAQFGVNGGMEHQTMSFMVNLGFALQAHETAHQWFGDKITCSSWEDIWLNEGFATYFEGLCQERFFPDYFKIWKTGKIESITSETNGSVKCQDTTNVSRIFSGRLSYNKGAYLLHMLRWKLGDAIFFQAIKNYLNDPLLAYNYANTENLIAHFEAASLLDLTSFFEQWFTGEGFPSYQINWKQTSNEVTIVLNQTQSHPSVSFFAMPVPIQFLGVGELEDTTIAFDHLYSGQTFNCLPGFEVKQIIFDPESWLISKSNTINDEKIDTENAGIIFPNPATEQITVRLQLTDAKNNCNLIIYNSQGKLVSEFKNVQKNNFKINTKQFSAGQYTMVIVSDDFEKNLNFQILK